MSTMTWIPLFVCFALAITAHGQSTLQTIQAVDHDGNVFRAWTVSYDTPPHAIIQFTWLNVTTDTWSPTVNLSDPALVSSTPRICVTPGQPSVAVAWLTRNDSSPGQFNSVYVALLVLPDGSWFPTNTGVAGDDFYGYQLTNYDDNGIFVQVQCSATAANVNWDASPLGEDGRDHAMYDRRDFSGIMLLGFGGPSETQHKTLSP